MTDPNIAVTRLLIDVVLPNLKTVQVSQTEQIAANDRLENAIEELRLHLESQFAHLTAQLTACRAELATTQALLNAMQMRHGVAHTGQADADPLGVEPAIMHGMRTVLTAERLWDGSRLLDSPAGRD